MRTLYTSVLLCFVCSTAQAQSSEIQELSAEVGSPSLRAPVSPLSGAELRATQEGGNVTLKVGGTLSGPGNGPVGVFDNWSLAASTPINKDAGNTDIATFDGLANASSIEFKFMETISPGLLNPSPEARDAFCERLKKKYVDDGGTQMAAEALNCDTATIQRILGPETARAFNNLFWARDRVRYVWGASAKVGYQSFKFFDGTTLAANNPAKTPWSAGAFVALSPVAMRTLFTLSFAYQESYKDSPSKTLCPSGSSPVITCVSGPIGSPSRTQRNLVSFELRKAFDSFGVSALATYDAKAGATGFLMPIYFVPNGAGGLTGGIEVGWRSDVHKTTVGVFVGQAFSLFN